MRSSQGHSLAPPTSLSLRFRSPHSLYTCNSLDPFARSASHTLRSFGGLRPPHSLRFSRFSRFATLRYSSLLFAPLAQLVTGLDRVPATSPRSMTILTSGDTAPVTMGATADVEGLQAAIAAAVSRGSKDDHSDVWGAFEKSLGAGASVRQPSESSSMWDVLRPGRPTARLDMKEPATKDFMDEMAMLHALPSVLQSDTNAFLQDDVPDFLVLPTSGAQEMRAAHGADSDIADVASSLFMHMMSQMLSQLEAVHPGRVMHQSLVTHRSTAMHGKARTGRTGGRHLLAELSAGAGVGAGASAGANSTVTYTSAEISNYQIKAWTMVMLILISIATCWGFCSMDVTLDPMLRMKIKQGDHKSN